MDIFLERQLHKLELSFFFPAHRSSSWPEPGLRWRWLPCPLRLWAGLLQTQQAATAQARRNQCRGQLKNGRPIFKKEILKVKQKSFDVCQRIILQQHCYYYGKKAECRTLSVYVFSLFSVESNGAKEIFLGMCVASAGNFCTAREEGSHQENYEKSTVSYMLFYHTTAQVSREEVSAKEKIPPNLVIHNVLPQAVQVSCLGTGRYMHKVNIKTHTCKAR